MAMSEHDQEDFCMTKDGSGRFCIAFNECLYYAKESVQDAGTHSMPLFEFSRRTL